MIQNTKRLKRILELIEKELDALIEKSNYNNSSREEDSLNMRLGQAKEMLEEFIKQ